MRTVQQRAKDRATKLHSELVRARGACECCGRTENLQAAHIISRRYARTRTRLDNAFCLCAKCHMHFTEWPVSFGRFVTSQIGRAKYDELREYALSGTKVDWVAELGRLQAIAHESAA